MAPETETPQLLPVVYEQSEATLIEAAKAAKGLTIKGPDDRAGYDAVRSNRLTLKGHRVAIDKQRKSLNEDALDWQRRVNAEAKRLVAIIEPTERELEAEETRIDAERERIKAEAAAAAKAKLDERVAAFARLGVAIAPSMVAELSDEEYASTLELARIERAAEDERARVAAEEAAREKARLEAAEAEAKRVERERLAAERAEIERQKAEQAAERKRLDDERAKALEELQAAQREREAAQAKLEAERRAFEAERAAKAAPVVAQPDALAVLAEAQAPSVLMCRIDDEDIARDVDTSPPAAPSALEREAMNRARSFMADDQADPLSVRLGTDLLRHEREAGYDIPDSELRDLWAFTMGYLAGVAAERARKAEGR